MTDKATTALDKKLFADLQLTDEVLGNDYAADGVTVVGTCRIPIGDLLRKGIVPLDAPLATVNSANTVSVAGPMLGYTTDSHLVVRFSATAGANGWTAITGALRAGDAVSSLVNDSGYQDAADVAASITAEINNLLDGAPGALDTLNELSAALGDDPDFAATVTAALAGKEASQTPATQAEAEAGTVTAIRSWSPLRVKQAVQAIGQAFADAAEASADAAATQASAASASEANAAASESAASTSETNAAASAGAASTSETNAAASESAASTSETNAAASAGAASTSETNAAASESAAATSASDAEQWANTPESTLVPTGNGVNDYSALHWAKKAEASAASVDADEIAAADNRRAFAGGVALGLEGVMETKVQQQDLATAPFTLYWKGKIDNYGGGTAFNNIFGTTRGVQSYAAGSFGLVIAPTNELRFYNETSASTFVSSSGHLISLGEELSLCMVVDPATKIVKIWVNGVLGVDEVVSGMVLTASRRLFILSNSLNNAADFNGKVSGVCYEAQPFNRALSATEALKLSDIGIEAWLAKYPEDQWGGSIVAGSSNTHASRSWSTYTHDGDGNFTAENTNITTERRTLYPLGDLKSGQRVKITIKSNVASTGSTISTHAAQISDSLGDTFFSGDALYDLVDDTLETFTLIAPSDISNATLRLRVGTTGNDVGDMTQVVSNLDIKIVGALAAYPMTEGIGRQPRDLSGRYDALLSATGYQHLKPKSEGYVRVKGADASSAIYMLEASEIIPADSVITDIIAEERKVAVANTAQDLADNRIRLNPSGSDLQIQRSDGTTHDTLGTVTAPTSLSDIDAELHYKQQAR